MVLSDNPQVNDNQISSLKSFKIYGLFGYKDIELPLDKQVLILIAENGSGKTTILKTLYSVFTQNLDKLDKIDFENIDIRFINFDNQFITANIDKNKKLNYDLFTRLEKLKLKVSEALQVKGISEKKLTIGEIAILKLENIQNQLKLRNESYNSQSILDIDNLENWIIQLENLIEQSEFSEFGGSIFANYCSNFLYFPTYRRIEEDLSSLGYEDIELEDSSTKLIQSGMEDVEQKFIQIQKEIKNTAFNLYSQVTGEMLTQFIDGINITDEMKASIKPEILDIILSRVGEQNISQTEQEKIRNLVSSGEINNPEYNNLIYFLSKLINLYEQQRKIDESIKSFVKTCNKYLKPRKEIIYNESTAEIYIRQTRNNEPIELTNLSSGEKQIISLFSKVYLESQEEFILIIDEPELSLSVEWQEMLLPDIIDSGRCKLLIAATHSPFIFNNKLDSYAVDLDQFVTEH